MTIGIWLGIGVAFVTDAVPTRSSVDWLYGVEARRDAHARVLAARAAAQQAPVTRRAARTVPAAESATVLSARLSKAALASHVPAPRRDPWPPRR